MAVFILSSTYKVRLLIGESMSILNDLFKGLIVLSIGSLLQHGCSVRDMAEKAATAHSKGLTSYGAYSRMLTGHKSSWATSKNNK